MTEANKDRTYSQFDFQLGWDTATDSQGELISTEEYRAGFREVSGLGMEVIPAEYRPGKPGTNEPIKSSGTMETPEVIFKHGVIGRLDLYNWLDAVRNGDRHQFKTVCIKLMNENRSDTAQEWISHNARPMKYTAPSLNGKATDLAIEELEFSAERITMPD